jgi:hypothetical protein
MSLAGADLPRAFTGASTSGPQPHHDAEGRAINASLLRPEPDGGSAPTHDEHPPGAHKPGGDPPKTDAHAKVDVSDGSKITRLEKVEDLEGAPSLGHAADAVKHLKKPDSDSVAAATKAVEQLGVKTDAKPLNVIVDVHHQIWASPAAVSINGQSTMIVPDANIMQAEAEQLRAAGGEDAVRKAGLGGKQFTDAILPEDVALHETEHLRQFEAGAGADDSTHLAIAANPLDKAARQTLVAHTAIGSTVDGSTTQHTDDIEQEAISEGMADTVAMTRTKDWRIGEGYFKDESGAVRDINHSINDDQYGAFTDYTKVRDSFTKMREAENKFNDAAAHGDKGGEQDAARDYVKASDPINADGHLAGTIIPRTFRELQQKVGWEQTQKLADAVGTDKQLWGGDITFKNAVESMRRNADAIDPSGGLRRELDASLDTTNLADLDPPPKPKQEKHWWAPWTW